MWWLKNIIHEINVHEDLILECFNLDHQIQQKLIRNFRNHVVQNLHSLHKCYGLSYLNLQTLNFAQSRRDEEGRR